MFVALSELCAQCYALVCKSELFRQAHTTHHITIVITNIKKPKPRFYEPKKPWHSNNLQRL